MGAGHGRGATDANRPRGARLVRCRAAAAAGAAAAAATSASAASHHLPPTPPTSVGTLAIPLSVAAAVDQYGPGYRSRKPCHHPLRRHLLVAAAAPACRRGGLLTLIVSVLFLLSDAVATRRPSGGGGRPLLAQRTWRPSRRAVCRLGRVSAEGGGGGEGPQGGGGCPQREGWSCSWGSTAGGQLPAGAAAAAADNAGVRRRAQTMALGTAVGLTLPNAAMGEAVSLSSVKGNRFGRAIPLAILARIVLKINAGRGNREGAGKVGRFDADVLRAAPGLGPLRWGADCLNVRASTLPPVRRRLCGVAPRAKRVVVPPLARRCASRRSSSPWSLLLCPPPPCAGGVAAATAKCGGCPWGRRTTRRGPS